MSRVACASLALVLVTQFAAPPADAQSDRRSAQRQRAAEAAKPLTAEGPVTSIVSLNQQRMYVYDANGFVTQTRVSSGRRGHETPKGIYSILEKKVDHTSNIYLDAKMPHMQRLTMTGIALHGGVIPGYPASGGCVRLPYDFARRFFNVTSINQRVIIAPDAHEPVVFEHPFLFASLPSMVNADASGSTAIKIGVDVADALLGVSSAHAATEPGGRTIESAAEARRAERQALVDDITRAGDRRTAAAEGEKAAAQAIDDARTAARATAKRAGDLRREAGKAKSALQSQDRKLRRIVASIPKNPSRMRADRLESLKAQEAEERTRIQPLTDEAERTAAAAQAAADEAKVADEAIAKARSAFKVAKDEVKEAANAEATAKRAVASFDRQEGNRELPVSVFISSATGMISIRQGFERVLEVQASIENPEVPLDTFLFTAVDWADDRKTTLKWQATEVRDEASSIGSFEEPAPRKGNKRAPETVRMPYPTDSTKAAQTLDRIKIPKEASERIAEVVKPGSVLIVSSYDISRSEMKYPGTDFVVQMPEVVAKITRPTPRPRPVDTFETVDGGFFFFGGPSNPPPSNRNRKKRASGSKGFFW